MNFWKREVFVFLNEIWFTKVDTSLHLHSGLHIEYIFFLFSILLFKRRHWRFLNFNCLFQVDTICYTSELLFKTSLSIQISLFKNMIYSKLRYLVLKQLKIILQNSAFVFSFPCTHGFYFKIKTNYGKHN